MFLDVADDGDGDEVSNAHLSAEEEPDLGAADIVLDELLYYIDVLLPGLQCSHGLVDGGAGAFDDEGQVATQDMVEVFLTPYTWGRHGVDQVSASQEGDLYAPAGSVPDIDSTAYSVDLVIEVIQHQGCRLVFLLYRFPRIYH